MSKSKDKTDKTHDIEDTLAKKFGKVFTTGEELLNRKSVTISCGPVLDMILGGGIMEGTMNIITGPPKLGKTVSALHIGAMAQQTPSLKFGDRKVYLLSVEGRLKPRDVAGVQQLDTSPEKFTLIESVKGKILSGEDYIDIAEHLVNDVPGCAIIFDSFSALCTKAEMSANIQDRFRADSPLLLARFCRRISNVLPINDTVFIGITHMIANQGYGMSPWTEASGRKLQYQVDNKLKGTHVTPWKVKEKQIGQKIHWECQTSALGPPGGKGEGCLRYGYGIDQEAELIQYAIDLGIMKKGGAWISLPDDHNVQGIDKAAAYIKENGLYDDIYGQIKDMLCMS